MKHISKTFLFPHSPGLNFFVLSNGSEVIIDTSILSSLDNDLMIECDLCLRAASDYNFTSPHSIALYQRNSDNTEELIDCGEIYPDTTPYFVFFNVSKYLLLKKYKNTQLVLKNQTGSALSFSSSIDSFFNIDYIEEELLTVNKAAFSYSFSKDYSVSINPITHNHHLSKSFFKGLLPYDVSIVFSNLNRNENELFSTIGWKLSILDFLKHNYDISGNLLSIDFYDKNNNAHRFLPISGTSFFYSVDGSGLLIEKIVTNNVATFHLFSEQSPAKKIFDVYGNLLEIINENNESTTIYHNPNGHQITYTDPNGNVIDINEDTSNSTITVSLNTNLTHTIFYDNDNNVLYQIDNEELTFDLDFKLKKIETSYGEELEFTFNGLLLSLVEFKRNDYVIDSYSFGYNHRLFEITNHLGTKTTYYYNDDLKITMSGELTTPDNSNFVVESYEELKEQITGSTKKPLNGKMYKGNLGNDYVLLNNNSSNTEYYLNVTTQIGNGYTINQYARKYLLIASVEKVKDVPFNEKRIARIVVSDPVEQEIVATLNFDTYLKKQTLSFIFESKMTSFNVFQRFEVALFAYGFDGFGNESGVKFYNPIIVELPDCRNVTYYANKRVTYAIDGTTIIQSGAVTIDNISWWRFNSDLDSGTNKSYSYEDLVRNYISIEKNLHFFWNDNFKNCIYETNDSSQTGYTLRTHNNVLSDNMMFGKKTLFKTYTENNTEKEIYDFEYLSRSGNTFIYTKIHHAGDTDYKNTKTYDLDFKLLREDNYNGDYTEYEYDSSKDIVKAISGNSNSNEIFRSEYEYDNHRLTSSSSLVTTSIESTNITYVGNYEIESTITDEVGNTLTNTYSSDYSYISRINKGSSNNYRVLSNPYNYRFHSGTLTPAYRFISTIDNDTEVYTYEINKQPAISSSVVYSLTTTKTFTNESYIVKYQDMTNEYSETFVNKYGNTTYTSLTTISGQTTTTTNQVYYYYFDEPKSYQDLVNVSGVQPISEISSKSLLYKIIDVPGNRVTYYQYDGGKLVSESIEDIATNLLSEVIYTYDVFDRVSTKTNGYSGESMISTYNYVNYIDSKLSSIQLTSSLFITPIDQVIVYDDLNRINYFLERRGSNHSYEYKREYEYFSKTVTENNESITLASSLINKVLYYSPKDPKPPIHMSTYLGYDYSDIMTYDKKGNITSLIRTVEGSFPIVTLSSITYTYDSNNRLTKEQKSSTNYIQYAYDERGNITSKTIRDSNGTRTISYTYNSSRYKNLLDKYNNKYILYNYRQNPISYDGKIFSYDSFERLTTFSELDQNDPLQINTIASYSYNHNGIRTQKVVSNLTHDYYLEGKRIIAELITDSSTTPATTKLLSYLYGQDGLFGIYYNSTFYYLRKNILGDIIEIYNGKIKVASYEYDAYGNTKVFNGSGVDITNDDTQVNHIARLNPFRYRGYYHDEETKFYYCNSRYYVPEWCRWLTMDSSEYLDPDTIDGLNLFAYCLNNPIMYRDEDGNDPWNDFWYNVGEWFKNHWVELTVGAGMIALGALTIGIGALAAGAGLAAALSAAGTAAIQSLASTLISTSISGVISGGISELSGGDFWSGFGSGIASGFMWGGIISGAANILGGALFITKAINQNFNGFNIGKIRIWSPNKLYRKEQIGGTLIKLGEALRIDTDIGNLSFGLHLHLGLISDKHYQISWFIASILGLIGRKK